MKLVSKLTIWLFVLLAFAVLALYFFVETNGKPFLEHKLSAGLGRQVTASQVRFVFPVGLRLDDLSVEGVLKVKEARAYLSFPVIFGKTFYISHIILKEPQIMVRKTAGTKEESAAAAAAAQLESAPAAKPAQGPGRWDVLVDELDVVDGKVNYQDTSHEKTFVMEIADLELKARSVAYPLRSLNTSFNIAGIVLGEEIPFSGSRAEAEGWVNWKDRNMDAQLVVKEPSGTVGLSAGLKAKNNVLTITGSANIDNLTVKPARKEGDSHSTENFFLDVLQSSGIKLDAAFSIKTKLDDFEVSSISFSGNFGGGQPGSLRENLKNIGQKFEDFGKQLIEEKKESLNAIAE